MIKKESDKFKILYITSDTSDYLSDSIFHGLRKLYSDSIVDFPKADRMYKSVSSSLMSGLHGAGFTCYGLLDDINVDRQDIFEKVKKKYFELIIFSSIQRQFGFFVQYYPWLTKRNTIIIDGEDTTSIFKYCGNFWRQPRWFFLPKAHSNFLYFKREIDLDTLKYLNYLLLPNKVLRSLKFPKLLREISFSIPEEKIINYLPDKSKQFAKHIVDPEVSAKVLGSSTKHVFTNEDDYYSDLRMSKFAITTKRAGWDCIRHYEIAANGCVMCFRDLQMKHPKCAPHGLNYSNTVIYESYEHLINKLDAITNSQYEELQANSMNWVRENTTVKVAKKLIETVITEIFHS